MGNRRGTVPFDTALVKGTQVKAAAIVCLKEAGLILNPANPNNSLHSITDIINQFDKSIIGMKYTAPTSITDDAIKAALKKCLNLGAFNPPVEDPLSGSDASALVGAALTMEDNTTALRHRINVDRYKNDGASFGGTCGTMNDIGAGPVYANITVHSAPFLVIAFFCLKDAAGDLTIPIDDLTITLDGNALQLKNSVPIVVPKPTGATAENRVFVFIDVLGNMYLKQRRIDGVDEAFFALYDDAAAEDPV